MPNRSVQILTKQSNQPNSPLPASGVTGEGFINTADGKLFYKGFISGTGSTTYLPSLVNSSYFEVGAHVSQLKVDDGIVSYGGLSGADLVGKFLSGTTNGFVLANISNISGADTYLTGGTYSDASKTLTLSSNGRADVVITGFVDRFVTGATFTNNVLLSTNNLGGTFSTLINSFSGLTVNGAISSTSVSATTISGVTFFGDGSNLTGVQGTRITAITNSNNVISILNSTGGTLSTVFNTVTGLTVNGALTSTSVSATTLSGGTLFGNGSNLTGIGGSIITGGTFVNNLLTLTNSTGGTTNVLANSFSAITVNGPISSSSVSATTISGGTLFGNGSNLTGIQDTRITAFTNSNNVLSIVNSTGGTLTTVLNTLTGLTVNGNQSITGTLGVSGATTIGGALTAASLSTTAGGSAFVGTGGLVIGSGGAPNVSGTGDLVVNGNLTVFGNSFSAFTSQLYVEDNNIMLNYNPTGDTFASAVGSGISIQDGLGVSGGASDSVFLQLARTSAPTTVDDSYTKTYWESNLANIMLNSSGGTGTGFYVIKENDVIVGGYY